MQTFADRGEGGSGPMLTLADRREVVLKNCKKNADVSYDSSLTQSYINFL